MIRYIKRAMLTLTASIIMFLSSAGMLFMSPIPVVAQATDNYTVTGAACQLPNSTLFGIPTWYKYLEGRKDAFDRCTPFINTDTNQGGSFAGFLPIGLAIIDMLLRIAGLVAVGAIIYSGFMYITSQGEPDKTTRAKDGIINALVGMGIVVISSAVVAYIGSQITK